jgi:ribosomal-protein-alanine N-acetyltransferase
VKQAQQLGAARLFLEVAENNSAGRALYERLGFTQVGKRPRYYPSGIDALLLARNI